MKKIFSARFRAYGPDTPEVRAEQYARATKLAQERGLQPGTPEYSTFVDKYVDPRGIPPSVVEDAIVNGIQSPGNTSNTFVYDTSDIRVVVNSNGKVERSHREDQKRFYTTHRFYSLADFGGQLAAHQSRSNTRPMRPLHWLSPKERLSMVSVQNV